MIEHQPPTKRPTTLKNVFNDLQDWLFEALAELGFARDRLVLASRYDDQETVIERLVFARMQRCACACCRANLPQLLEADRYDQQQRYDGHEAAAARLEPGTEYVRGVSTRIEAGRFVLFARNGRGL
jgi:hypothetical protein